MYSQVSVLPVAGAGTVMSGAAAYTLGGIWFWVFAALAVFTLIGAIGALVRTAPPMRFLYRAPKQFAPAGRPEHRNQARRRR